MYSAQYGFNGAPPQAAHLQPSPNQQQAQQTQQQQQQQQQMMYNAQQQQQQQQQFPIQGQGGPFPGGHNNPAMIGSGPAGMMQNAAMPHMAATGQMAYQAPFTSSPYGAGIPSSAAPQPQLPANFMMGGPMNQYQMNAGLQQQQQQQPMMQRMHPGHPNAGAMSTSTPQRPFNPSQSTPATSMAPQQTQYGTPQQPQSSSRSQTPTNPQQGQQGQQPAQQPNQPPQALPQQQQQQVQARAQSQTPQPPSQQPQQSQQPPTPQQQQQQPQQQSQPQAQRQPQQQPQNQPSQQQSGSAMTPQTPTFPANGQGQQVNGNSRLSTPQSPGGDPHDKERVKILFDINTELLYESMQLSNAQFELKKEAQAAPEAGVDYAEQERLVKEDYNHCMKRLQVNFQYQSSIQRNPATAVFPAAFLTAPPLSTTLKLKLPPASPDDVLERPADPNADRLQRIEGLKQLYAKLQALFPGVDPKREQPAPPQGTPGMRPGFNPAGTSGPMPNGQVNAYARAQAQTQAQAHGQAQGLAGVQMGGFGSNHSSPAPGPPVYRAPQMANSPGPLLQTQPAGQ